MKIEYKQQFMIIPPTFDRHTSSRPRSGAVISQQPGWSGAELGRGDGVMQHSGIRRALIDGRVGTAPDVTGLVFTALCT